MELTARIAGRRALRLLAQLRSLRMPALSPLLEHEQTQRGHPEIDADDPEQTWRLPRPFQFAGQVGSIALALSCARKSHEAAGVRFRNERGPDRRCMPAFPGTTSGEVKNRLSRCKCEEQQCHSAKPRSLPAVTRKVGIHGRSERCDRVSFC